MRWKVVHIFLSQWSMSSDDNLNTKVNLILSAYVVTHRVLTKKPNIIKKKNLEDWIFQMPTLFEES